MLASLCAFYGSVFYINIYSASLHHCWCFYFYWRQCLQTRRVQEVPRFVVMWLEEEVDEGQLIYGHVVLDADRDRINRLSQINL